MKKVIVRMMTVCILLVATSAFAKQGDKSAEATLTFGTEPSSGIGSMLGGTVGGGYEFRKNLQARGDISYLKASKSEFGVDLSYTRIPVDVSVRYICPISGMPQVNVYGQGGLELSFDTVKLGIDGLGSASASETHFGIILGGGGEYAINQKFGVTANMLYHVVTDGYLSIAGGLVYHFK